MSNQNTTEDTGKSLIFLISQPRAGSTLTQKILSSHPAIHTSAEPWIMLHPLHAIRNSGYKANYNEIWAQKALLEFLKTTPHGEESFYIAIRHMSLYLYNQARTPSAKPYFLDKTPRYYEIIPELYKTFPSAKFVFLLRNPLAVLCSIITSFLKGDLRRLRDYSRDLVEAPRLLTEGISKLGEKAIVVQYENLITTPDKEFSRICNALNIAYTDSMLNYGNFNHTKWQFGDQKTVDKLAYPDASNLNKWTEELSNPQTWRFARDYMTLLSPDVIDKLGYCRESMISEIEKRTPASYQRLLTRSLYSLIHE